MLRSAATSNPRKHSTMPDHNPTFTTTPIGVGPLGIADTAPVVL
jgi:hypothetical protein